MNGYRYPHTKLAFDVGQFAKKYWLPLSVGGGALAGGIAGGLIDKEKPARGITIGALGGGLAGPAITYGGMKLYKWLGGEAADEAAKVEKGSLGRGISYKGRRSRRKKLPSGAKRSLPPSEPRESIPPSDPRGLLPLSGPTGLLPPPGPRGLLPPPPEPTGLLPPPGPRGLLPPPGPIGLLPPPRSVGLLLPTGLSRDSAARGILEAAANKLSMAGYAEVYPYEPSNLEKLAEVQDNVELFIKVAEEEGIDLSYMDPEELVYRAQVFADALEEDDYWDDDYEDAYYWAEKEAEAELLGEVYEEAAEEAFLNKLAEFGLV